MHDSLTRPGVNNSSSRSFTLIPQDTHRQNQQAAKDQTLPVDNTIEHPVSQGSRFKPASSTHTMNKIQPYPGAETGNALE